MIFSTETIREWRDGRGHCIAAIEALKALTCDVSPAQADRYDSSEAGSSRLINDFYSYATLVACLESDRESIGTEADTVTATVPATTSWKGTVAVQEISAAVMECEMARGGSPWIAVDDDCTFDSRMCENQVHNRVHITGLIV